MDHLNRIPREEFSRELSLPRSVFHLLPKRCSISDYKVSLEYVRDRYCRHNIDWRYRRARWLLANKYPLSEVLDDQWVRAAYHLLQPIPQCRSEEDYETVHNCEPDVYQAWQFWHAPEGPARWESEARLMTKEPFDVVAQKVGLSPRGIEFIEKVFFNVRDRLDCSAWINHKAVRAWSIPRGSPEDLGVFLRLKAWQCGPLALDFAVRALTTHTTGDLDDPLELRRLILIKACYAIHSFSCEDPRRTMRFLRTCFRLMQVFDAYDQPQVDDRLTAHVEAFYRQCQVQYGDLSPAAIQHS